MKRSETTKFLSQLLEKSCFSGPGKYWDIDGSCGSMIKYCDMSANLSAGQCH